MLLKARPEADVPSARATRAGSAALVAGTGLLAAVPVIFATARALAGGWMPVGDQGIIATRAYDVFSSHAPLLGQYSQASTVAGHPLYSPGPMLYWLLALPARFGAPATLTLAIAAVNVAAILGSVALARRRGGLPLMFAAAAAIAVMSHSLSSESLHDIFNPSAGLFPFVLLAFTCWSIACGDVALLPVAVVLASFVAQCHLTYLAPAAGMLVVALAISRSRRRWRWLAVAAAAAVVCWSAPVLDQIEHSPGNLGLLARTVTAQRRTEGSTAGWRTVVRSIGVPPRWLRRPTSTAGSLGGVSGGDYGDTRLNDIWTAPGPLAVASTVLILCALAATLIVGALRRRRDLAAGAAIALVLCAALASVVATTPGSAENSIGYTTWWGSAAGMWVWLILAWAAASLLWPAPARRTVRAAAVAAGVGATAAAAALAAAAEKPDAHTPYYRPARVLTGGVVHNIPRGRTVWLIQRGFLLVPIEPALRFALRQHSVRPLGTLAVLRLGAWYERDHRRYTQIVSVWSSGNSPPVKPGRVVARTSIRDRKGVHLLTAATSAPQQRGP